MKMQNTKKAETLIEVVVSVGILMTTLGYSITVIATGFSQIADSQTRVIATSLAKEGIEAMRNIIGSNLLRLNEDPDECWNAGFGIDERPVANIESCAANKIGNPDLNLPQTFRLIFHRDDGYFSLLDAGTMNLDDIYGDQNFGLYIVDENNHPVSSEADISLRRNFMFVDPSNVVLRLGETLMPARFFRAVQIRYIGNDAMEATSAVLWGDNENEQVLFSTILTQFVQ